jgi:cation:H+ antiporter
MVTDVLIFIVALVLVVRSSMFAIQYAEKLAEGFNLSPYTVGFVIAAIVSILPETFISLNAALAGVPSFGFGMLLGSNVADLTVVVALVAFIARRPIKVEAKILKNHIIYPSFLLLPIVLGFDGHFTRVEGAGLILAGAIFYYLALREGKNGSGEGHKSSNRYRTLTLLVLSMATLLVGAHFTVSSATDLALAFGVSPVLIGMLVVGLGTTVPELFFSLRAVKANDDSLAIGDILGTVLADATIVVGILALVAPFSFPKVIIYVAGVFMVASAVMLMSFMQSGRLITRKEAFALVVFWLTFVIVEFIVNV